MYPNSFVKLNGVPDLNFDHLNFLNCIIEAIALTLFFRIIDNRKFEKVNYLITYLILCFDSIIITFIDGIYYVILPLNFFMLFLGFWIGFRRPVKETLFAAIFAFLILVYLQCLAMSFLPSSLLGENYGNLIIDCTVLIIAVLLVILSQKFKWANLYQNHLSLSWGFLSCLCIPEIIIVQFLVKQVFNTTTTPIVIILLLSQILYVVLITLIFSILTQRANSQKLHDTQKYIDELNNHLDDSRKGMHDFNKHIRYLRNTVMLEANDPDLLKEKVNTYCQNLFDIYDEKELLLHLDNSTFRALLYGRKSQAAENGIKFILTATPVLPDFPIMNYQLVEIFDNLMDNAFESVAELPEKDRWIRVTLSVSDAGNNSYNHMLCIENPFKELDFSAIIAPNAYTSKKGKHFGVGLNKISKLVSSTDGSMLLNHQNGVFTVKVVYNVSN